MLQALQRSADPAFEVAQRALTVRRAPVMLGYVGIAYPAFYALDLVMYPEHRHEFALIRAFHALVGLGALALHRRWLGPSTTLRIAQASAITATASVAIMCFMTEGFSSLYVTGMILCFLAISTIEVFRVGALLTALTSIGISYVAMNASVEGFDMRRGMAATSFVVGAILFCGISAALMQQHRRELFEANLGLVEKNDALARAHQLQGQFLSTVSHELRAPVNSMLGFVELVEGREPALHPKSRGNLVRVRESGRRLLGLINDLLDLSKVEAGRMEVHLTSFDLMQIVAEVAEATRALVLHRELPILVAGPRALLVRSDEHRVRQILTNLASNAAKFTEHGCVTLGVSCEASDVVIEVSDTGPGIPAESRAIVFEAFRQHGLSAGGTGLGLSIVQRLVHLLEGTIELESEVGRGSTFRVRLGRIAVEAAA